MTLTDYKDMGFYDGDRGTLEYVAEILHDYDGANSVESLKELIDEVREIIFEQLRENL